MTLSYIRMTPEPEECHQCERTQRLVLHDSPYGWMASDLCLECWENYEPPEPDYDAVSGKERYEQAWEQKRRLR